MKKIKITLSQLEEIINDFQDEVLDQGFYSSKEFCEDIFQDIWNKQTNEKNKKKLID
jgi:hypothetical protein